MGRAKRPGPKPVGRYSRVRRIHLAGETEEKREMAPSSLTAMTGPQPQASLVVSDLTSLLLHSLAAAPVFCSSSLSIPKPATTTTTTTPTPLARAAIMVPKELITQRLQSGAAKGRSWQVLQIIKTDGLIGLYAGYAATLLRNLPAGVLSYSSFEYLKAFTLNKRNKESLTPGESVLCGALAGAISAALTTPLDVVKTRPMTRVSTQGSRTVLGTMREVVAEEGLMGLSRGIGPRVLHSTCFAALGYCAFETARFAILQWYIEGCQRKAAEDIKPAVAAA
jgi:hypothetical protein